MQAGALGPGGGAWALSAHWGWASGRRALAHGTGRRALQQACGGHERQARGRHDRHTRGARGSRRGARAAAGLGHARHAGAGRGRGARPGHAVGPTGYALGALGLLLTRFDSLLFLSQFLDIVHQPGS